MNIVATTLAIIIIIDVYIPKKFESSLKIAALFIIVHIGVACIRLTKLNEMFRFLFSFHFHFNFRSMSNSFCLTLCISAKWVSDCVAFISFFFGYVFIIFTKLFEFKFVKLQTGIPLLLLLFWFFGFLFSCINAS